MTAPLPLLPQGRFNKYTLHPHQAETKNEVRNLYAQGARRIIVQCPCAWGKTIFAADIINNALPKGKLVAFTIPALSLLNQTVSKFFNAGIYDVGIMQADHPQTNPDAAVQVISLQTLRARQFPKVDIVFVDEAHICHKVLLRWMAMPEMKDVLFIGLTATPGTKGLGKHWERSVVGGTIEEMIAKGYLCDFRVFAPESHLRPDLSDVKITAGDYNEKQLSAAMRKPELIGDAVEEWFRRGGGRPTLIFCVDCAHAKDVQEAFEKKGVKTGYIDAYIDSDQRDRLGSQLKAGEIDIVINIETCVYGLDWPFLSCIVWLKPTWSTMVFVQAFGRGLRIDEGKTDFIFIDHTDTITKRLGLPPDITFELDTGNKTEASSRTRKREKGEDDGMPVECIRCHYIKKPGVRKCPACGFEPRKPSDITYTPGQLTQIRGKDLIMTRQQREAMYGQLLAIAGERKYQPGWAKHKYKDKFGVWPDGMDYVQPMKPSRETRNWVKSRRIAWAKATGGHMRVA